jgi:hypothetical protein
MPVSQYISRAVRQYLLLEKERQRDVEIVLVAEHPRHPGHRALLAVV